MQKILWAMFVFFTIIFIHEFGHFIVARICKIKIKAFSIGFGAKLYGLKDKFKTEWRICVLPLGGYVSFEEKISTQNDVTKSDIVNQNFDKIYQDKSQSSYESQDQTIFFDDSSLVAKSMTVFAGPLANYILTILIFIFIFLSYGKNQIIPEITFVENDTPAARAGIDVGDKIIAFNGNEKFRVEDIIIESKIGNKINLRVIKNDSSTTEYTILPQLFLFDKNGKRISTNDKKSHDIKNQKNIQHYSVGIAFEKSVLVKYSLGKAILQAITDTLYITKQMCIGIIQLISGKSTAELSGPIKIMQYTAQSADRNFKDMLAFVAILSLNLGFINLLPIPGLDGGHLFIYAIEAVRGKQLKHQIKTRIMQIGYAILISLMIFAISNDIIGLFK